MELTKTKFKQTEVGLIPEDWHYLPLVDCVDYIHGKAHEQYIDDFGKYVVVNSKFISSDGNIRKHSNSIFCSAKVGDILTVLSDLPNGKALAKCFFVDQNNTYAVNQRVCIWRPKRISDSRFLFYVLNRNKYFLALNDGVSQTHILNHHIEKCNIQLPPTLTEQKAIATALCDADELIAKLEKLIEKKKAIKQGAMQALLSPKEDWKEFSIFELADNRKDLFDDGDWIEAEHITDSGIRLIQTGNIGVGVFKEKDAKKYIYEESFNRLNCKLLQTGDLLICRLADPAGRACIFPEIGERRVITSVDVTIFRPAESKVNRIFLMNVLSTPNWFKQVTERVGGTTHKRISRGSLGKLKVKLPSINEQNASAEILSDVDNEIIAYEKAKSKIERLKQGMMQELLTGKTRLV